MTPIRLTRRQFLISAAATSGATMLGRSAHAKGSVTAAMYPGTWEDAFRAHVVPMLKKTHDVDLEMTPLFAVDQIAKAQAARGAPPFDAFVLDPGRASPGSIAGSSTSSTRNGSPISPSCRQARLTNRASP